MTWSRRYRRTLRRLSRRRTRALGSVAVHLEADTTAYGLSMAKLRRTMALLDLRRREAESIARYRRRIAHERDLSLAYVRVHARRVRAELGLEYR